MRPLAAFWVSVLLVVAGATLSLRLAPAESPPRNRPLQVPEEGYVTSDKCQACHPSEYETWHSSYHRSMTQVASPETVLPPFDGRIVSAYGKSYRLERRGDEYWVIRQGPADDAAALAERRIVLTTGSHRFQAYWLETRAPRMVTMFPLAYRIAERSWMPFDWIFLSPPDPGYAIALSSNGLWNSVCAECHTTRHRPRLQVPGGMDTHVGEFGIACEACHGPAEEHVRKNHDPSRRYGLYGSDDGDPSIVQPERLSHRRSTEVCGQCHSVHSRVAPIDGRMPELGVKDYLDQETRYQPGQVLADHQTLVPDDGPQTELSDVRTHFWPDGQVRVNGREYNSLVRSPCFQRGEMSCLSCHVLHQEPDDTRPREEWANDQLKPGMHTGAACLECHESFRDEATLTAHTHHAAASPGSDCMNCHMPYSAWGLQKATRSHEIANPSVRESIDAGRPNACNLCHLDRTLAWTAEQLASRYGIESPPLDEQQRSIAAGVLWLLAGDAAQRALVTWSMGWEAAHEASGEAWMAPYLGVALVDDYPTTRFAAARSLGQIEGFEDFEVDPMASDEVRAAAAGRLLRGFAAHEPAQEPAEPAAVLMTSARTVNKDAMRLLVSQRNNRHVHLLE